MRLHGESERANDGHQRNEHPDPAVEHQERLGFNLTRGGCPGFQEAEDEWGKEQHDKAKTDGGEERQIRDDEIDLEGANEHT